MNRLLVLTELFLPTKGGTAVWAAEVYKRLGGKEIHIVTADVPGAAEVDAAHPNTIHRLNLKRIPWLRPESLAMYAREARAQALVFSVRCASGVLREPDERLAERLVDKIECDLLVVKTRYEHAAVGATPAPAVLPQPL